MIHTRWGKMVLATACVVVSQTVWADSAVAQQQCSQRTQVVEHLAKKYKEAQIAVGVTGKGALVEVLSTEDGGTWSILLTNAQGVSCLVASGEGWRVKEPRLEDLDPAT